MFAVVMWVIFAIATGAVANEKGRNVGVWAILGLLFGLFALIVVALLPKVELK